MQSQTTLRHWTLDEIESQVCDLTATQFELPRAEVAPQHRIIEDLNFDSLDLIELIMEIEERFAVTIPDRAPNEVYKAVFTRQPFRLRDLAELVYLQQGTGTPRRNGWTRRLVALPVATSIPFTQLDGRFVAADFNGRLYDRLEVGPKDLPAFRRRTDGMRCVLLRTATVEIGDGGPWASPDEQPAHDVVLDEFLIDAEPVSTVAYARFLNSIGPVDESALLDWFVLESTDRRNEHSLLVHKRGEWQAVTGTERFPMVLVSWYGANAYSLWANACDWRAYSGDEADGADQRASYLPSEAQWEYAARGRRTTKYPWGNDEPTSEQLRSDRHRARVSYTAATMPLAAVNEKLGMSPFGLHHMAGNVWQWCRDWYDPMFYVSAEATKSNAQNRHTTGVRSERGGSWVSPAALARSSYRRARPPRARGRCLGFRCVGDPADTRH